ncbi:nucleoside phosphorylase [Halovenus rubra]|uniref:Nucleoside phosphorylase n=2 Tax=Halovenus rubra TaxID=869890 RepID=A0ABD5XBC8_9EURY|nr:nucleoside phosphorylase [Halovenus rubra]
MTDSTDERTDEETGTGHGSEDPKTDEQYHLEVSAGDVADAVLLPGNPERVAKITDCWDGHDVVANHREYRTATGTHDETPISVTSTGIGAPSSAIAVEELARVGAETLIRVGSCGAIQEETDVGDLIITSGAVRQEGTSTEYVREEYPAVADYAVVAALAAAAEELGYTYHVGLTASTDSFYAGQSREGFEGFLARDADDKINELREAGVLNFEMEASAILTLANIYGLRAGAVCTVYADRTTGEFQVTGESKAAKTASKAVSILAGMDEEVKDQGASSWHALLGS